MSEGFRLSILMRRLWGRVRTVKGSNGTVCVRGLERLQDLSIKKPTAITKHKDETEKSLLDMTRLKKNLLDMLKEKDLIQKMS